MTAETTPDLYPMTQGAERAWKRLTKSQRTGPAAPLMGTLKRSAARSLSKADWLEELAADYGQTIDRSEVAALRQRAEDALDLGIWLNWKHGLGRPLPLPSNARPTMKGTR